MIKKTANHQSDTIKEDTVDQTSLILKLTLSFVFNAVYFIIEDPDV